MRLNIKYKSTKNEKKYFEETKFNERFGECSLLLHQNVESHMYKVTN